MVTRYSLGAGFAIPGGFLVVVSDSGQGCAQRILDGAAVGVSALLIALGVGASDSAGTGDATPSRRMRG